MTAESNFRNPVPGDENADVCQQRQMERGVPASIAKDVCRLMSTILPTNAYNPEEDDVTIVPVVLTAEGVHNGAYKPWDAIKAAANTFVGVPVLMNQPGEHEQGKWPPVDDETRHHGVILQVNVDEENRRLTGIAGLYSPETMEAKGASKERVKFQGDFLNAVNMGGRFAVSIGYGTKLRHESNEFNGKPYNRVEEVIAGNSVSIVPRGAEPQAVINGHLGGEDLEAFASDENKVDANASVEGINTPPRNERTTPMDVNAEWLKNASLSRIRDYSPEVNKLAEDHAAREAEVNKLRTERDTFKADLDAARAGLAKLVPDANEDATVKDLISQANTLLTDLQTDVNSFREKERKGLEARANKAREALKAAFNAEEIKAFEDPNDLASTVNRLETLAKKHTANYAAPPGEELAPEANFESTEEADEAQRNSFTELEDAFKLGGGA